MPDHRELSELINGLKGDVEQGDISAKGIVERLEVIYKNLDDIDTDIFNTIHNVPEDEKNNELEKIRKRIGI